MNCIVCEGPLKNFSDTENHPLGGTEFWTRGHYGSAITDCMDSTKHIINVCDPCLRVALENGRCQVIRSRPKPDQGFM